MLNLVLLLSLSHTGHWKFNMAPHGKELSEDLKKRIVALHASGFATVRTLLLIALRFAPYFCSFLRSL